MSYILDALRRADAERERGAVPGLHTQNVPADPEPAARDYRPLIWAGGGAGALLLVVVLVLAFAPWRKADVSTAQAPLAPAPELNPKDRDFAPINPPSNQAPVANAGALDPAALPVAPPMSRNGATGDAQARPGDGRQPPGPPPGQGDRAPGQDGPFAAHSMVAGAGATRGPAAGHNGGGFPANAAQGTPPGGSPDVLAAQPVEHYGPPVTTTVAATTTTAPATTTAATTAPATTTTTAASSTSTTSATKTTASTATVAAVTASASSSVSSPFAVSSPARSRIASASVAASAIPKVADLPATVQAQLPHLTVGGAIYSDSASSRMVILNGQVYHEGDKPATDTVLEQIRLKSAVLNFRGQRYEISY